jgi:hypothetical protein
MSKAQGLIQLLNEQTNPHSDETVLGMLKFFRNHLKTAQYNQLEKEIKAGQHKKAIEIFTTIAKDVLRKDPHSIGMQRMLNTITTGDRFGGARGRG